jgi:hypothetical protein
MKKNDFVILSKQNWSQMKKLLGILGFLVDPRTINYRLYILLNYIWHNI